jgi:hypothetical protein
MQAVWRGMSRCATHSDSKLCWFNSDVRNDSEFRCALAIVDK